MAKEKFFIHIHWLTKELVGKTLKKLKPKRCFGFDRVPLVFLKDGASELSEVVTKLKKKP